MNNLKPVLLTADGYTLDRKMRLVPVDATSEMYEEMSLKSLKHSCDLTAYRAAIAAAPSPDPAVFAENDPSLYIAFSDDGDRIVFWTRSRLRADEQAEYTPGLRIDSFRAVKDSLTARGDEKAHRFAGVEEPKPTPDTRQPAPSPPTQCKPESGRT